MSQKLIKTSSLGVFVLMALVFTKLYIDILRQDFVGRTPADVFLRILSYLAAVLVHYFVYRLLKKKQEFLERYAHIILAVFLVVLFCLQLYFGNIMRIVPKYDFSSIYDGAVQWVVTGSFSDFYDYFYYYPNNLGPLFTLTVLFRVAANFGIQDFYMTAVVFNCVLCAVMVFSLFQICKRKFSRVEACYVLYLLAVCPPVYLLGAVFYTDVLTICFPVTIYYLFLCLEEHWEAIDTNRLLFIGCLLGIALLCLWGKMLKPTVLIMLVAVFIALLLKRKIALLLILMGATLIPMAAGTALFEQYIYSNHLDRDIAYRQNTPMETWIMMGLNENSGFSPDDTEFSRSIEDPEERKVQVRKVIRERIEGYGLSGMADHLRKKGIRAYGDGTFEFSEMFMYGLVNDTGITEYVTLLGSHYGTYWNVCSLMNYTNLFYMVVFLWASLWKYRKREEKLLQVLVAPLSFFGLYLFLMVWEVHPRYTTNFVPVLMLLAVMGMVYLQERKQTDV